jgi:hypothetical protein
MFKGFIRTGSFGLILLLITVVLGTLFIPAPAIGKNKENSKDNPSAEARQLTQELIALREQFLHGNAAQHAAVYQKMLDKAARRHEFMSELMEQNPAEALHLSIPAVLRRDLPAAVQEFLEEDVMLEGTFEATYECGEDESRLLYSLHTESQHFSMHFAHRPPEYLQTGARVRARGMKLGTKLALDPAAGNSALEELAPAFSNTFGEQMTAVILVNFENAPSEPYTKEYARNVVFNTTSSFDMEGSQSRTWLNGDVFGWYTIPVSSTVCDTNAIATYAKQAAIAAGVNLSAYNRFVFGFPRNACSWWGLATLGGNPSHAFIKGSFTLKVVGHEMGHNLGLCHSHSPVNEYGDTLDIMGNPSSGHFNAFQKEQLGWLNYSDQPPITTVETSGNYSIDPYSAPGQNPKALKILKSMDPATGDKTWYYVEHRRNIGFDSGVGGNSNVLNGVVIHTGSESSRNSSFLLDLTPETPTYSDPALVVGDSFRDPEAGVTITALSASASGAIVNVSFGSTSCVPRAPSLAAESARSQYAEAGSTLIYNLSLKNNDSVGCRTSVYDTSVAIPDGWASGLDPVSVALDPGASTSVSLEVTSAASAEEGLYDISVYAGSADSNKSTTAQLGYGVSSMPACIPADPTLEITSAKNQSAGAGEPLTFSLILTNNDSAGCEETTFTISASSPARWSAGFDPEKATLEPGESVSINATIVSASDAVEASYAVPIRASSDNDSSKAASVSVMHIVAQPLSVVLSVGKPSYTGGEKVNITAEVTSDTSPIAGASVAFTIVKADGGSLSKVASTGPDGTAVCKFQLPKNETPGQFQISAEASWNSESGKATISFNVINTDDSNTRQRGRGKHK